MNPSEAREVLRHEMRHMAHACAIDTWGEDYDYLIQAVFGRADALLALLVEQCGAAAVMEALEAAGVVEHVGWLDDVTVGKNARRLYRLRGGDQ